MRDINLALGATAGGLFLKTRIFSAHLWSLNYKPWGTGLFGTQKKQLLNIFMATQSSSSAVFRKYAPRIAETLDRQLETEDDYDTLFDDLPFLARSFNAAMDLAKVGRWFSWNSCARDQLGEYWVQKMILEDHLGVGSPCASAGLVDPDESDIPFDDLLAASKAKTPQAQLAQLKAVNGGLRLAYKLMTSQLYDHCRLLYTVTKPLWNWYTDQVQNVKSPKQGLVELASNADRRWMRDPQFADLITNAFHSVPSLSYMDLPPAHSVMSSRLVSLVWNLLSHRAWSLAARHHSPPQRYVELLSHSHLRQRSAMQMVEREWKALAQLEQRRLTLPAAMRLWSDMQYARLRPLRLFWALCEGFNFDSESCVSAKSLLRGMLETWPDNKIVEDVHNVVKADTLKSRSCRRSSARQSDVMVHSGILEARGLSHTSRVTKSCWMSSGGHRSGGLLRAPTNGSRHFPQKHKLPGNWALLMGKKVWDTSTEANSRKSLAAWHWFQEGRALAPAQGNNPPKLCDALLTRLLHADMVLERRGSIYASLGNYSWSALVYPLYVLHTDRDGHRTVRWGGAGSAIEFVHVVDLGEWSVLTCIASLAPAQGIVLQETERPRSLLKYSLQEKCASMSLDLLQQVAGFLGIASGRDRKVLLRSVADQVFAECPDKDNIVDGILKRDASSSHQNAAATLLQDPLFEAAWDEMAQDEQLEFPEVRKEKTRGRVRRHLARRKEEERQRKRRRIRGPREQPLAPAQGNHAPDQQPPAPAQDHIGMEAMQPHEQPLAPAQGNRIGRHREAPGVPRGVPWGPSVDGRPMFLLARTHARGVLNAITVTCNLHRHGGMRCNKSLTLGAHFSEDEALRRIKAWCVAGLTVPDGDGARQLHMDPAFFNPRTVSGEELKSHEELDALVSA